MTAAPTDPLPIQHRRERTLPQVVGRAIRVGALALAFLTGFLPMWVIAGRRAAERDSARRELRLVQLEALAAAGTVDARRGRYDWARQSIDHWFMVLRAEMDLGASSCLSPAQRSALGPLLKHHEQLVSALARGEPSSVANLTTFYLTCRTAVRQG